MGGESLPPYADPQYGCQMELLRFDCRTPAPRFVPLIAQLRAKLANAVPLRPISRHPWATVPSGVARSSMSFVLSR